MPVDVSAPMPDLTLEESSILTIDTGDPGAVITQVVIHVSQEIPDVRTTIKLLPPQLAYLT
jgi:hypothetical protein